MQYHFRLHLLFILYRECESGLGASVVHQVQDLLSGADPEDAEVCRYVAFPIDYCLD